MSTPETNTLSPVDGPAVEQEIALDMIKRALPFAPVLMLLGLFWGWDGAASVGYGIVVVCVNFLLSAVLLSTAARFSLGLFMTAALFGYVVRLGCVAAAILLVKDQAWVELVPLGLTIIVTHLGLLVWESRYVSTSLAFPGVMPKQPGAPERKV